MFVNESHTTTEKLFLARKNTIGRRTLVWNICVPESVMQKERRRSVAKAERNGYLVSFLVLCRNRLKGKDVDKLCLAYNGERLHLLLQVAAFDGSKVGRALIAFWSWYSYVFPAFLTDSIFKLDKENATSVAIARFVVSISMNTFCPRTSLFLGFLTFVDKLLQLLAYLAVGCKLVIIMVFFFYYS